MHTAAFDFVRRVVQSLPPLRFVAEFGSRSVNGSVKEIFTDAARAGGSYWGVDIVPGPGVDEVVDAAAWTSLIPLDAVVCCEVFEHAPDVPGICASAYRSLRPGGAFIVTCASQGRAPHSAEGDGPPRPGEHYANVDGRDLARWLRRSGFDLAMIDPRPNPGDLYALAMRVR